MDNLKINNNIILSIIIPNFNNALFLKRCLNSIFQCESNDIEIIVIDDGSNDNSLIILNDFKDDRLKIISQHNQGVSAARNNGIKNSKGKHILFCDSDDYYEKNAIEYIVDYLKKNYDNNDIILFNSYINNNGNKSVWIKNKIDKLSSNLDIHNLLLQLFIASHGEFNSPWNKIYKSEIIKNNNIQYPVGIKTGEDGIFNIKYVMNCSSIRLIENVLYCYCFRESNNNSTVTSNLYKQLEQLKEKKEIKLQLLDESIKKSSFSKKEERSAIISVNNFIATRIFGYTKNLNNQEMTEARKYIFKDFELYSNIKNIDFRTKDIKNLIRLIIVKLKFNCFFYHKYN